LWLEVDAACAFNIVAYMVAVFFGGEPRDSEFAAVDAQPRNVHGFRRCGICDPSLASLKPQAWRSNVRMNGKGKFGQFPSPADLPLAPRGLPLDSSRSSAKATGIPPTRGVRPERLQPVGTPKAASASTTTVPEIRLQQPAMAKPTVNAKVPSTCSADIAAPTPCRPLDARESTTQQCPIMLNWSLMTRMSRARTLGRCDHDREATG
jgi:hypothetical protein